ncbi:SAM-dependent methyltransferase [Bradyrhizobium sp. SRS-191]|uniref:SAM-dependent methyltransferase n=1 Tax=Bradyrhizobium sp. SRS-191 TaxID=2962606 RepID=UPI00211DF8C8|nr:SAM-dependent methyltransferase [Bradyrhizobium sp. SRS-191]
MDQATDSVDFLQSLEAPVYGNQSSSIFLGLDFRWPTPSLTSAFRRARDELSETPLLSSSKKWPDLLASYVKRCLDQRLLGLSLDNFDQKKWVLRDASALGAMLMHMEPRQGSTGKLRLINSRRRRTEYSTYPTSPLVAEALAFHIWRWLASSQTQTPEPVRILDPSMEGGPLLLEIAFRAQSLAACRDGNALARSAELVLCGVDKNPASATIVSDLLRACRLQSTLPRARFDLRCQDAFDVLSSCAPLDGVVNNPPWGAATDGADSEKLVRFGPYAGYRDVYIAFMAQALKRLRPGRPFGFVLPFQVLTAASAAKLRAELLENCQMDHVILLPKSAFPRATVKTVALLGCRRQNGEQQGRLHVVRYPFARRVRDGSSPTVTYLAEEVVRRLDSTPWLPIATCGPPFVSTMPITRLGDVTAVKLGIEPYRVGRGHPEQTRQDLRTRPFTFERAHRGTTPVVRSRHVSPFRVDAISEHVRIGPWLASHGDHTTFMHQPRVFVRQICGRDGTLVAAIAPLHTVSRYGVFTIICDNISPDILCALLNSGAAAGYVRTHCAGYHKESFGRISAPDLRSFPVPTILLRGNGGSAGSSLRAKLRHRVRRIRNMIGDAHSINFSHALREIDLLIDRAFGAA